MRRPYHTPIFKNEKPLCAMGVTFSNIDISIRFIQLVMRPINWRNYTKKGKEKELHYELISQTRCSPYLDPATFFPGLKELLAGKIFHSNANSKLERNAYFEVLEALHIESVSKCWRHVSASSLLYNSWRICRGINQYFQQRSFIVRSKTI